jgi:hypothetical protein
MDFHLNKKAGGFWRFVSRARAIVDRWLLVRWLRIIGLAVEKGESVWEG